MSTLIRLATPLDSDEIAAIYRPAVCDTAVSFEIDPPNADEMASRITTTLTRTPWIVCARSDEVLGYAYATGHRARAAYQWSVEVSAYVRDDVRRAGVATALYESLFAVLTLQGFRNAYAGITLPNPASVGLHEALGFASIGVFSSIGYKHGVWHDVAWMERELAPRVGCPQPPLALPDVDGSDLHQSLSVGLTRLHLPGA